MTFRLLREDRFLYTVVEIMKSTSVVLSHKVGKHLDLSSMEKSEISKNLYGSVACLSNFNFQINLFYLSGQIQWEEILRSGVFLQHRDVRVCITCCPL